MGYGLESSSGSVEQTREVNEPQESRNDEVGSETAELTEDDYEDCVKLEETELESSEEELDNYDDCCKIENVTEEPGTDEYKEALRIKENLEATNPNYELGEEWQVNCQRCVPTYEMRNRGYDVTALPCTEDYDYLSYHPFEVWESPDIVSTSGNGMADIESMMEEWGDGSRAQVVVFWENGDGGHTFVAEQRNGKTYFIDPQTGETDVEWYFDNVQDDKTMFCRIDRTKTTNRISECCKGV